MTASKKILLYTDESTSGGAAHYNHALLEKLLSIGWCTHAAQPPNKDPMLIRQRERGVIQWFLSYDPRLNFTRSFTDITDPAIIIDAVKPDIIFFSDCSPISNLAAKQVALARGIPYLVMCHSGADYLAKKFPEILDIVKQINQFAIEVIAISPRSLNILRTSFGLSNTKGIFILNGRPEKYFTQPNLSTRELLRQELEVPESAILCFTSARFDAGKGYQYQIAALKQLHAQGRLENLYFAWAGVGELHTQVLETLKSADLLSRVRLLGQRWDISELLEASDLFALTTINEGGLPLAAMEAMAKGIPTIITSVSGIDEIVGTACHLLPDPNKNAKATIVAYSKVLTELADNPDARKRLGTAGRQLALKCFRESDNLRNTIAVIERAINSDNIVKNRSEILPTSSSGETSASLCEVSPTLQGKFLASAIVSTYKSERFIAGCLDDLVAQTLFRKGKLEIIIVDSGSVEGEGAIVREYQRRFPNIVYVRTDTRETLYAAWNRGIRAASGRFITNANTDDRHRPNALELMAFALDDQLHVDLIYGDCYLSTTPNEHFSDNPRSRTYSYPDFFAPAALLHYQFGPQPMWRKSVHESLGYFDASLRAAGDYDFNLRLAQKHTALHLPVVLGSYLIHGDAISFADKTMQHETQQIAARYHNDATIERLYRQTGVPSENAVEKAQVHFDLGLRAMQYFPPWNEERSESNISLSIKCFLRSIELEPQNPQALNNLFCLLAWSNRKSDALGILARFPRLATNPIIRANRDRVLQQSFIPGKSGHLNLSPSCLTFPSQRELATGLTP